MACTKTIECWIVLDKDGDHDVGIDRDSAIERFEENIGSAAGARIMCVRVTAALPEEVTVAVRMPDEAGDIVAETV